MASPTHHLALLWVLTIQTMAQPTLVSVVEALEEGSVEDRSAAAVEVVGMGSPVAQG